MKKQAPEMTELTRKEEVAKWAKERLLDPKTLILDVETTGLLNQDPKTEVVSISLINTQGKPVLSALVNPGRPIPMASQKIHGIDDRMVKDQPPWYVIGDLVAGIIHGKHIVAIEVTVGWAVNSVRKTGDYSPVTAFHC